MRKKEAQTHLTNFVIRFVVSDNELILNQVHVPSQHEQCLGVPVA